MAAGTGLRALAAAVRAGERSALDVAHQPLAAIAARNGAINAFTTVTGHRALAEAEAIDAALSVGRDPGPPAGVPVAVKNVYDIAGLPTVAGSRIDRDRAPAARDAAQVRRLTGAGTVRLSAAGHLGVFTQPLSFAALPVVAAPVASAGGLPLGVQIVAAPWREDLVLRVAAAGEALGALISPTPVSLPDAA